MGGSSVTYSACTDAHFVVVAALVPKVAIFRFQSLQYGTRWNQIEVMVDELRKYVGSLDRAIEWTSFDYGGLPAYANRRPCPHTGIFRYDCKPHEGFKATYYDVFDRTGIKLADVPRGWIET